MPSTGKRETNRGLLLSIAISALTAALSIVYFIFKEGGFFYVVNDFNAEVIPYYVESVRLLKEGGLQQFMGWDWHVDMGASFVNSMSYYSLGSPFFWICLLFPAKAFPYLAGWIYILKYIAASAFSYLYIRRFTKDMLPAVAGSLLYAFSGFQSIHLVFYFFHDVVAFFPLLLIGAEKVLECIYPSDVNHLEGKTPTVIQAAASSLASPLSGKNSRTALLSAFLYLTGAVFLNALVNYYFFVQDVVFLVIYFLFRTASLRGHEARIFRRDGIALLCFALAGVFGVAMSAVLFLPSILYVLAMPRSVTELYLSNILYSPQYFLYIVRGFLMPGEIMNDQSSFFGFYHTSTSCWLPLVGISLAAAYLFARRDWLSRLLKFLLICSFIPLASTMFLGFSQNYQRWWYAMILMMALASSIVIEERPLSAIRKGTALNAALLILFYLAMRYLPWSADMDSMLIDPEKFLRLFLFALAGVLVTGIVLGMQASHRAQAVITAAVCIVCVVTTAVTLRNYRRGTTRIYDDIVNQYQISFDMQPFDQQYRYNTDDNMFTMLVSGNGSYSSTLSNSHYEFDDLFDQYLTYSTVNKNAVVGLSELTAGKYLLQNEPTGLPVMQELSHGGKHYYVEEQPACPIGFDLNAFVTKDDLKAMPLEVRAFMLLGSAVVNEEDMALLQGFADRTDGGTFDWSRSYDQYVDDAIRNGVTSFTRDARGFSCIDENDRDHITWFSVPADEGWTATIDGANAPIIDSGGMMLLTVPAGTHRIEFTYETPWLKEGIILSAISMLLYIVLLAAGKLHRGAAGGRDR